MGLEIQPVKASDGPELADLYFSSFEDNPTMRSVFEGPITQEMKQWYIKLRLESIEGQDPDTFDICTRDTETGEIVSVATFKVEAEKTTDNYKQIKTPETQYPANMDGDRLNQYMRTEQEKSIETMGGRAHICKSSMQSSVHSPHVSNRSAGNLFSVLPLAPLGLCTNSSQDCHSSIHPLLLNTYNDLD